MHSHQAQWSCCWGLHTEAQFANSSTSSHNGSLVSTFYRGRGSWAHRAGPTQHDATCKRLKVIKKARRLVCAFFTPSVFVYFPPGPGIEPRAAHRLVKGSTTELHSHTCIQKFHNQTLISLSLSSTDLLNVMLLFYVYGSLACKHVCAPQARSAR